MKVRRVLALVMAVLMVIGLMPAISAVHNQEPVNDEYFTVTKTAESTDVPGVYDIKVTVAPKEKANVVSGDVEVVFLLDTSSSMAWCTETNPNHAHTGTNDFDTEGKRCEVSARDITKERLHIAKTAINKMISSLNTAFQNSGSTLTVSVVTYASESSVKVDKAVVTNETLGQITKKVSDITSLGGTYMESGLKKASLQFSSGNSSKYLIMIGDGDYDDENYWDGFLFWGEWNYATDRIKDAASAITKKGATLMTVGFTQNIAIFKEIASKKDGKVLYYRADTNDALNTIMGEISEEIKADGIVLNDYVGDTNAIVDTNKVKVSDGAGNVTVSENSIKWDIPKDAEAGKAITLTYQIKVDPEKINTVGETDVKLNGDETTLSYTVDKQQKTIKVGPPTDILTVGKLNIEYYFDGFKNDEMGETKSAFVTDDAKFAVNAPASEVTVGEDENQKTYELEKALLNDSEYSFAADSAKIDVSDELQTLKIYYKEKTVEPEEPVKTITVKFDPDGGKFADGTTDVMIFTLKSDSTDETTNTLYIPDAPEKDGYVFDGWYQVEGNYKVDLYSGERTRTYDEMDAVARDLYGDKLDPVITFRAIYEEIIPDPEEKGIIVEIRLNKNEGTWADNFGYDYKPMLYAPDNTTTKTVPTVKEDTFTGWYKGNEKVDLGSSLTYEEAKAIGEKYGVKSENDKYIAYNVVLDAKYTSVTPDPIDPPFIVIFPTLEISNKVIAPKNFEKTSFEYDIINVKTGDVEKSVTLKADSSVRVMVTGGTEYMVVPKNLEVPGYIVTTTSTPDSATVTSDKIGNVSVDFTHIYVVGLNTEDHYAYIRGYEDGTIRPEGNITRAEVATIFYRLLSSEALAAFKTTENTFTDVDSDAWYNLSVSTLAKAGVISGYPDGSFNPNGKITRAELVSIATRFFTTIEVGDSKFEDIGGHWAAKAIDEAYIKGIIKGYSDGTFRPDQAVTRAEAMKIVNGILGRPIDTCVLIEGIKLWPDVASDAWYYYVVAEATNAHRYELTTPEKWTAIIINEIEY